MGCYISKAVSKAEVTTIYGCQELPLPNRRSSLDLISSDEILIKTTFHELQSEVENVPKKAFRNLLHTIIISPPTFKEVIVKLLQHVFCPNDSEFLHVIRNALAGNDEIENMVLTDFTKIKERDPCVRSLLNPFMNFKEFHALVLHRIAHEYWMKGEKYTAEILQGFGSRITSVDIHPGATIGVGVVLDHGNSIVIGETAEIGNDVYILHGVTLGAAKSRDGKRRHPRIGNNVFLGAYATLIGAIEVGDNCKIGAAAVVTKDVEANQIIIGTNERLKRQCKGPPIIPSKNLADSPPYTAKAAATSQQ